MRKKAKEKSRNALIALIPNKFILLLWSEGIVAS
jgi:hypothetical protein